MATSKILATNNNTNNVAYQQNNLSFFANPTTYHSFSCQIHKNHHLKNHRYKLKSQNSNSLSTRKNKQNHLPITTNKQNLIKSSNQFKKLHKNKQEQQHIIIYQFLNQIRSVVSDMTNFNKHKITFLQYLEIFIHLKIIPSNYEPQSEKDKVILFWNVMTCNESSACLINLSILFFCIMNINININVIKRFFAQIPSALPRKNFNVRKKVVSTKNQLMKTRQGYFSLTKSDINYLRKEFHQFRDNLRKVQDQELHQKVYLNTILLQKNDISSKAKSLLKIRKEKYLRSLEKQYHQNNDNFNIRSGQVLNFLPEQNDKLRQRIKPGKIKNECRSIKMKGNQLQYQKLNMNQRSNNLNLKLQQKKCLEHIYQESMQNQLQYCN